MTRRIGLLIIAAGVLVWLIIGGYMLSIVVMPPVTTPTVSAPTIIIAQLPTLVPTLAPSVTVPPTQTPIPTRAPTDTPIVALPVTATSVTTGTILPEVPPFTATPVPGTGSARVTQNTPIIATGVGQSESGCPVPSGWVRYAVTDGDTLFGFQLGSKNTLTVDQIMQANCLKVKLLAIGQIIYLPPGVGAASPKVDDGPAGGPALPAGTTRRANCPCTVTIRAGWRREQIAAALDLIPVGFVGRDFLAVTGPGAAADFGFLSSRPAGSTLEGFLYPGSYTIQNDTSVAGFRDMLLRAFDAAIPDGLRNDAAARGLTFYQAVVLASIVQRESYAPVEQVQVASVMYNRMAAGKALSSTVTVQYAIGTAGAWWPKVTGTNLRNRSKYNTYIWLGLTPAPISNPDFNAINATIHPAQTNYQYFNGSCDGPGNFYTETYAEFEEKLKACGVIK